MRVYIAAPYADAEGVRGIHVKLKLLGCTPTSQWATLAAGPEDFAGMSQEMLAATAACNDRDLLSSEAVLVLARAGAGGEMFAEARLAQFHLIPVYWVGRLTLSAWRTGVTRCVDLNAALALIEARARSREL